MKSNELLNYVFSALLLAIGFILNSFVPGFVNGIKPDFMLAFMFLAILITPTLKNTFIIGVVGGFLSAISTSMPGGQIPNFVEKIITTLLVYLIIKALVKILKPFFTIAIVGFVGTLISGAIFISAVFIVGLIPTFSAGLDTYLLIVLPTAGMNLVLNPFIYYVYDRALTLSGRKLAKL